MTRLQSIDVSQHPSQVLDWIFLVHCFDLVQKSIDRIFQLCVNMKRQASLCDFGNNLAPQHELIRTWIRFHQEHRIMERTIDAFSEENVVDVIGSLKDLQLSDLRKRSSHLIRRRAGAYAADAKHSHSQPILIGQSTINRQ